MYRGMITRRNTGGNRGMVVRPARNTNNNNWIKNVQSPTTPISNANLNNWIKNAPNISGQNFRPWFNKYVQTVKAKGGRLNSKNNISMFVKSARARAGLDLYKKYKGFYINAHGFCIFNTKKFIIPKDKAVLFVVSGGKMLMNNKGENLERKILKNNGRIQAFIQGSTNILANKIAYADYKGRLFLPGEEIYEHFMHFTRSSMEFVTNAKANYSNNENLKRMSIYENKQNSLGPSFGRIWKLPLPWMYSSRSPFVFNRDKNKILWNLPAFIKNSTAGQPNSVRFMYRPQLQKLSTILRQGPPGVYIVGTCREDLVPLSNQNLQLSENFVARAMRVGAPETGTRITKFFNNVKRQNITRPNYVPGIRNTSYLRKLAI